MRHSPTQRLRKATTPLTTVRLDRAVTVYGIQFVRNLLPIKTKPRIPILMYHSVTEEPQPERRSYYKTNISPAMLEQQVRFLAQHNYTTLTLPQFDEYRNGADTNTEKKVVLTFDDGYENWYTQAFPILQKYNATATMFLTTGFIHETNTTIAGNTYLNWRQVREMQDYGINFGSHTVTHPKLDTIPFHKVEHELGESQRTLAAQLRCPVTTFAYPFAFPEEKKAFTAQLRECLQKHGYLHGVTTILGTNGAHSDPLFLKRLPVNEDDDLKLFQAKLQGSYNWPHPLQLFIKKMKLLMSDSKRASYLCYTWPFAAY